MKRQNKIFLILLIVIGLLLGIAISLGIRGIAERKIMLKNQEAIMQTLGIKE